MIYNKRVPIRRAAFLVGVAQYPVVAQAAVKPGIRVSCYAPSGRYENTTYPCAIVFISILEESD